MNRTDRLRLWYERAASRWEETLPIGNGSLGAMIWGGAPCEVLGLNEESLWSGWQRDRNNPGARAHLEEVRRLIREERYGEAEAVAEAHMLGEYGESYLPLGSLHLAFKHGPATDYMRELDLEQATARVAYTADGATYEREYLASFPARAILVRLTCSQPRMALTLSFESPLSCRTRADEDGLIIEGQCPEHVDPPYIPDRPEAVIQGERGRRFSARVRVLSGDGTVRARDGRLSVDGASRLVLAVSAVREPELPAGASYETLREAHIRDYRALFDRVELWLGPQKAMPTDRRLAVLREGGEDPGLYALYFQYGRYLLIASSRPGGLPANLQGIWCWELRPPWSSNWTTNINAQMNYWPAQSCGLSDCLSPYVGLLKRLCEQGQKTAAAHYGCRGFVHHHNADVWANTNPVGIPYGGAAGQPGSAEWALWPMGGAWMAAELYKHYAYTLDEAFLRETAYPLLHEAARFLADWLVEVDGRYETCPSTSPENRFIGPDGSAHCLAMSTAMDLAIIREVFRDFRRACEVLHIEDGLLDEIDERLGRLAPFQVGSRGQLLEWHREFEEREPGHRHLSHLYGLFPSDLFAGDARLTEACRVSLQERLAHGGGHTGWSCAWIINLLAVLEDGEGSYAYLRTLLTRSSYDNLWDAHPPFQIDGNFGGTAGIANMLVQDRGGEVKLLPALPAAFPQGYVRGLRITGRRAVDIRWENGTMTAHRIYTVD